jgi:hypothetical protein
MGQGSSLQSDEAAALLRLTSETKFSFDSDEWPRVMHYKVALDSVPPKTLYSDLADYAARLGAYGCEIRRLFGAMMRY